MTEIHDLSDLIASIEVWFTVLKFFEPDELWGWQNPILQQWQLKHGYGHRREMPAAALWLINRALERRYRTRYAPNRLAAGGRQ